MNNVISNKNINCQKVDELMEKSLSNNQFTNYGPNVQLLEKIIKEKLQIDDTKSVIVVNNGSTAIHLLVKGIMHVEKKNINWATQSFTFPPSAQEILSSAKILDIDHHGGINLEEVDNTIGGIIVTNIFGNIVDINKYINWAKKNNKFVIFDNAATSFTFYKGKNSCNYGNGATLSFHHTKPIGFGEGGAIIVDKKYESTIRKLMNFGIELNDNCYFDRLGNNYKMSDIAAIYIIQYLDNFDTIVKKHKELYYKFKNKLKLLNLPLKLFPSFHDDNKILPSCFSLIFDNYDDSIRMRFLENNIFCRKYYHPLKNTKNAVEIFNKILCIPCNSDMEFKDIDFIVTILKK